MKRMVIAVILSLFFMGAVMAESNAYLFSYVRDDWFAVKSAEEAVLPEGLSDREIEIYRAAYANGFYDALHPAYVEGLYMVNTKTKKYHLTNCPSTLLIETKNREYSTLTPEEMATQKGYKPCGQCHPATPNAGKNGTAD